MKKLSRDELDEWIGNTLKGWRTSEMSHAKALSNPSLMKAIKKDCEILSQIREALHPKQVTRKDVANLVKEIVIQPFHQNRMNVAIDYFKELNIEIVDGEGGDDGEKL